MTSSLGNVFGMDLSAQALIIPPDANLPQPHPDAPVPGSRIPSHYKNCFGCGHAHETGLHMVATAASSLSVTAEFEVTSHHQGAPGIAHGGLLALAFDEALGATHWLIRVSAVTAHLQVSYRAPVPVGTRVFIDAHLDAIKGRKIWSSATGRLGSTDGPLAVEAAALFIEVGIEHFTRYGRPEDLAEASSDSLVRSHIKSLDLAP